MILVESLLTRMVFVLVMVIATIETIVWSFTTEAVAIVPIAICIWTRTTFALNIAFWLWYEYLMRQLVLASLLIYFEQFDGYLVALFQSRLLNCLKAFAVVGVVSRRATQAIA